MRHHFQLEKRTSKEISFHHVSVLRFISADILFTFNKYLYHNYKAKAKSPAAAMTAAVDPDSILPALVVTVAAALPVAETPAVPLLLAVLPLPPATDVAAPVATALDVAVCGSTAA